MSVGRVAVRETTFGWKWKPGTVNTPASKRSPETNARRWPANLLKRTPRLVRPTTISVHQSRGRQMSPQSTTSTTNA
eukprot:4017522-Heterocapsa_arctica.AAC.1